MINQLISISIDSIHLGILGLHNTAQTLEELQLQYTPLELRQP